MGKTVARILTIASTAALIATGIGAGAGLALFGTTAGISIGGVGIGTLFTASAVLSAAAGAIAGLAGQAAPPAQSSISTAKNPTPPRTFGYGRRRLYGSKILFETNAQGATVDVYAFADGEADGVEQVYLNDDKVTLSGNTVNTLPDKRYQSGLVKAGFTLGQTPNMAFSAVIAALPGIWTANHRGDGVVTGYLIKNPEKEKYLLDTYPQGDTVELSAVFRLQKCFDPRTGVTAWTENPVLHLLHYLTEQRGYDYNTRIFPVIQYWINAANVCDEAVPLKGGGIEPRYRSCVTYDATRPPKEIVAALLETFDGWIAPRGDGALVIYAGKLYPPTVTLGPDEIINYNLPYGVASENRIDQFNVSYVSAAHDYNIVDTTPWGEPGIRSEAFSPQTPSHSQNRRLAKRAYARANEFNRGTIVTNLLGRKARGQRYVNLHIEESGIVFFSGMAEIVTVKRDFEAGGLSIEWIAVDENMDAWNPATEEGEPAPVGNRFAPQPLPTPSIASAVPFYDTVSDGGTGARVRITVDNPAPRSDYSWFARWKRSTDSAWNESAYTDVGGGTMVTLETGFVSAVDDIEVQVLYTSGNGQSSEWSSTSTVNSRTDATPPGPAQTPTILDWRTTLRIETPRIARASSYRWRVYRADGTTLVRTINTSTNLMEYSPSQAAVDGIGRSYVVTVEGANAAGFGDSATTGVITNAAPPQVVGLSATGGDYIGTLTFTGLTDPDLSGYALFYSLTDGFNPATQGFAELRGSATTQQIFNLAAGTYYARVAGYDGWSNNPAVLNLSDQVSFTITAGSSGGTGGSGDGGGGTGGGGLEPQNPIP